MMRQKGIAERTASWIERVDQGPRLMLFDIYRDGYRRSAAPVLGQLPRRVGTADEALAADTVLLCTSRRSADSLYRALRAREDEWAARGIRGVYRAGDCLAPRYIADVVFDGHRLGREIDSPDPQRPRAIIREQPIWGTAAYPELGEPTR